MSHRFPHYYSASLTWGGSGPGHAAAGPRPLLNVGPPPEFGGDERLWSPEHLLLSALNACLMATFGAVAASQGLDVDAYVSRAFTVLDRRPDGPAFTSFRIEVDVAGAAGQEERLRAALLLAKERCFVAKALRLPVDLEVSVAAGHQASDVPAPVHA